MIALHRDVTTAGGNLLINVGPTADATIPSAQAVPLIALGKTLYGAPTARADRGPIDNRLEQF